MGQGGDSLGSMAKMQVTDTSRSARLVTGDDWVVQKFCKSTPQDFLMRGEGTEGAKDDSRFLERTLGIFGRVGIASN